MKRVFETLVQPLRNLSYTSVPSYMKRILTSVCVRNSRVATRHLHICVSCGRKNASRLNWFGFRNSMNNTANHENDIENTPLLNSRIDNNDLSIFQRVAYGFGHVFNDLCAAMWFSYLLFYLQIILQLKSTTAGTLLMLGQVSDALATPIAGWAVDKYGTRKLWHTAGTIMVTFSFPLVFSSCAICNEESNEQKLLYHALVIIMFQIGWAIVQISHLSIIPNLTNSPARRSELTAIRYTGAVCSSVIAYIITWIVLQTNSIDNIVIGPSDYYKFQEIVIIILIIGILTSIIFYLGTKWKTCNVKLTESSTSIVKMSMKKMLLSPLMYQISFLYVASRLYMTLNLVYMPLYLDERVLLNVDNQSENLRESLATVPLVSYLASFVTSIILKNKTEQWGNKITYLVGSIISFSSCLWIGFYISQSSDVFYVYLVAVLIGAGSSITIVSSLCLTANVIGPNINQGASVYSIVTFTDKLICGLVVVIIEHLKCADKTQCPEYYRYVLAYVSGAAAIFGIITLITIAIFQKPIISHLNI